MTKKELFKNIDLVIDKTAEYFDLIDMPREQAPARNILNNLINNKEQNDYINREYRLVQDKIKEANLLMRDIKERLMMFD
jgi:hypothetical protein